MLRALARLGVEHEPDFPVPVGVEAQLPTDEAARAVERFGTALLMAQGPAGERLSAHDAHMFLTADREERRAVLAKLAEMRGDV